MSRCRRLTEFLQSLPPPLTLSTCSSKFPLPTSHPLTNPTGGRSEIHPQSNHFSPLSLLLPGPCYPSPLLGLPVWLTDLLPTPAPAVSLSTNQRNPSEILTSYTLSPQPRGPPRSLSMELQSPNQAGLQHLASRTRPATRPNHEYPGSQGSAHPIPSAGDDPPQYNKACQTFSAGQHSPAAPPPIPLSMPIFCQRGLAPPDAMHFLLILSDTPRRTMSSALL